MTGKTVYFRLPETEQKHKNSVTQEMLGKSISRAFRSYKAQFPQYSSKEYETVAKQFCEDFFLADEAIVLILPIFLCKIMRRKGFLYLFEFLPILFSINISLITSR